MSVLSYAVFTDPAPLQVSRDGAPSVASVYITVSNSRGTEVNWDYIMVEVPSGDGAGAGALTTAVDAISPRIDIDYDVKAGEEAAEFHFLSTRGVFRVSAPSEKRITLPKGGSFTLVLENIPVSRVEGLAQLKLQEMARCDEGELYPNVRQIAFALPKSTPKVPCNFRPDTSLVNVDAGEKVTLRWDGPDNLDYWIRYPDGQQVLAEQNASGPGVTMTRHHWEVTPKRGATYTLVAGVTDGSGQPEQGYFLTTTVHALIPEFESGTRTPWIEGTQNKGRATFSPGGVDVTGGGGEGIITAGEAVLTTAVRTRRIRGLENPEGWIEFPPDGIRVGHGEGSDLGTVTADKVGANGVNTLWVGDRDSGKGWAEFPQSGVHVHKDGQHEWGTIDADRADVNGVNTAWVQGRDSSAGWIEFPAGGVNVFQGAGTRQWGTVAAGEADLNDLVTRRAQVKERLSVDGGLTVGDVLETQDGPARLIVHGRLDTEGELNAAGSAVVGGDLTVNGDFRPMRNLEVGGAITASDLTVRDKLTTDHERFKLVVHGESLFLGKLNANRLLSVRTEDAWIMHVNDDQVSIAGNLRVHGAFRADD